MKNYSIYSFDRLGNVAEVMTFACRDDLAALDEGKAYSAANAVEIWQGHRYVAHIKLGNAALNAADLRSL